MSSRQPTMRLILTLCLVLFQVQLLAASALDCRHDRSGPPAHCMHHSAAIGEAAADQPDGAGALGCTKCDLGHVLQLAAAPQASVEAVPYRSDSPPPASVRFHPQVPEPSLRPPIGSPA